MLQQFIKSLISSIFFLVLSSNCQSQIKLAYNIGTLGTTGSVAPVFSGSIIIDSTSCLALSNGVKKMQANSFGVFTSKCQLVINNTVEIKLVAFPNPVISSLLIKTADNVQTATNTNISLEVIDLQGRLLKVFSTNITALNTGYEIKLDWAKPGIYFIRVLANNSKIELLKILKS